ncbi:MAG: 16S rRNA (guanine(966)-N(2))-methyltransferase RsmD [Dorea sp.]|nr:16S rRNA (guanine(966)-N(2))-methyltransferase RsmD [Dorea sp.]
MNEERYYVYKERAKMRVIAGSAKRIQLKTLEGFETRPTTDRIKETLFNMIDPWIGDCLFLDLFAGSGSIGIEALSRGAGEAVFIEKNRAAMEVIRDNIRRTGLGESAELIQEDVFAGLRRLTGRKFDYIFMDPPYQGELEYSTLKLIEELGLIAEDGMIIVEAALKTDFGYLSSLGYRIVKEKKYKTNKHIFIESVSTIPGDSKE